MERYSNRRVVPVISYFIESNNDPLQPLQDPALKHIVGVVIDGAVILRLLDPEPVDSGLPLLALQRYPDPKNPGNILVVPQDRFVRAYHYGGDVRFFLANTVTAYLGEPSQETRYSIAALPRDPYALCAYLARDILPTVDGEDGDGLSKNPHGFLDIKGVNTVVNFDDDILYFFKPNGFNGLPDGTNYIIEEHSFFDVQLAIEEADPEHMLPENAHGQFMVAATENGVTHIILGYICYDTDADTGIITDYYESVIVKLRVEAGMSPNGYPILSYVEQAWAGYNAATAAIGRDKNGILRLFLGVIGGGQQDNGATNGVASGIHILPFFQPWPQTAAVAITGDPEPEVGQSSLFGDVHVVASLIHELGLHTDELEFQTVKHKDGYSKVDWATFRTTSGEIAELATTGVLTISQALAAGVIRLADEGNDDERGPLRDIALIAGDTPYGDIRVSMKGGDLEFAKVIGFDPDDPSTYVVYRRGIGPGKLGGDIINTFTVTLKAIQEARKKLYQKHTLSGILPEALRSAARAARAATRATTRAAPPPAQAEETPPEEEETETETDNK